MGSKGMDRKFKCGVCKKTYAIDGARIAHEHSCSQLYNSKKDWISQRGKNESNRTHTNNKA